jgi:hypothetical protein
MAAVAPVRLWGILWGPQNLIVYFCIFDDAPLENLMNQANTNSDVLRSFRATKYHPGCGSIL